jgi:hypothetical protein
MSSEQEPKSIESLENSHPTSIEQYDLAYPKPQKDNKITVERSDIDEESLGYN